jgi:hypothetical protein
MKFEEFGALVARYGAQAQGDPQRYPARVAWMAWFGIAYIMGAIVLLVVMCLGSFVLLTASVQAFLVCFGLSLYALWSIAGVLLWRGGRGEPERLLTRAEAPGLFKTLDELGGRVDSVELVPQFNAGMAYIPRLGFLGWPRHHLVVGMSLLLSLSEAEARAVIAHELGHMMGGHTKRARWLYGQRDIWRRFREEANSQDIFGGIILRPFWEWLLPRFDAMSFVLARMQEYEADAFAAQMTSEQVAAASLVRVHVDDAWLDEVFWDKLHAHQHELEEAPRDVFTQIAARFKEARDTERMRALYAEAMEVRTGLVDTHPCLRERLEALGADGMAGLEPTGVCAAQAWFASLDAELGRLDAECFEAMAAGWDAMRRERSERARMFEVLEAGDDGEEDEALKGKSELVRSRMHAALAWERDRGSEAALARFEAHIARFPEDAHGHINLGLALLARGDEAGAERLRDGVRRDTRLGGEVGEAMIRFYLDREELAKADVWREKLERWERDMNMMRGEWSWIAPEMTFRAAELDPGVIAELLAGLARVRRIKRAWLVQKVDPAYFPDEPVFLLLIATGVFGVELHDELVGKVHAALDFPHWLEIRDVTVGKRDLRRVVERIEGSRLL